MDSLDVCGNFTMLSILKLILTYQHYRIAYIYATTDLNNDITSKIAESTWEHMVTVYHIDLDKTFSRNKIEEPTLNLFVVNNLSDADRITQVKDYLEPNDVTVILFNSPNTRIEKITFQPWMKLSAKVLILWKTFLIFVNQFGDHQIEEIAIDPYNQTATQYFMENYLLDIKDAKGANMTVFMRHVPPKSAVGPMLLVNNYTFNGPDGVISDLLFKSLNMSPTYVTDVAIHFPSFINWKKNPGIAARLHYYGYHREATTSNLISKFNVTANSTMDFYMSTQWVDDDDIRAEFNSNSERLYPHDTDCLLVIVPKQLKDQNFLKKVVKHSGVQWMCCALVVLVIARIIIQKASMDEWFSIIFKTLQFFLIQGNMFNRNAVEAAWTIILRFFSVVAIATISAILFKSLVNVQPRQIDTVADLLAENIPVFIPESLRSQFYDGHSINLELRETVVALTDEKFGSAFLSGELYAAFIFSEESGDYLMKMKSLVMKGTVQSYVMKEKLLCTLNSYRINKSSPFIRTVNDFLLRCSENGLYNKVHAWAIRLNDALYLRTYGESSKSYEIVIQLEVILSVFILYLGGMVTSLFVFLMEKGLYKLAKCNFYTKYFVK